MSANTWLACCARWQQEGVAEDAEAAPKPEAGGDDDKLASESGAVEGAEQEDENTEGDTLARAAKLEARLNAEAAATREMVTTGTHWAGLNDGTEQQHLYLWCDGVAIGR